MFDELNKIYDNRGRSFNSNLQSNKINSGFLTLSGLIVVIMILILLIILVFYKGIPHEETPNKATLAEETTNKETIR